MTTLTLCAACEGGIIRGDRCGNCYAPAPMFVGSEMPLVGGGCGNSAESVTDSGHRFLIVIALAAFGAGLWVGVVVLR